MDIEIFEYKPIVADIVSIIHNTYPKFSKKIIKCVFESKTLNNWYYKDLSEFNSYIFNSEEKTDLLYNEFIKINGVGDMTWCLFFELCFDQDPELSRG